MPYANQKLEWKIGEPGADVVCDKNVQLMARVFETLTKRCAHDFCKWPISALSVNTYTIPGVGDVCATCHDLYTALIFMNLKLSNPNYFKSHHDLWRIEQAEKAKENKERRRRLGLDGEDNGRA